MPNVTILITLEYLGTYGDTDDYVGVTLQVASDAGTVDKSDQLLRPWSWKVNPTALDTNTHPHIQLLQAQDGSNALTPVLLTSQEDPGSADTTLLGKLDDRFEALCNSVSTDGRFGWSSDPRLHPESAIPLPKSGSKNPQGAYRWPAQVAQIGRYPYPIAHQLNLSYFLKVNGQLPANGKFVAAPTFIANTILYTPNNSVASSNPDGTITIDYSPSSADPATGINVQALVQPLAAADCKLNVRVVRSDTPIANQDPYLSLPQPEDTAWQHTLIPLTAELFDPAARLIGAFRLVIPQKQTTEAKPTNPVRNPDFDALYKAIQSNFEVFRQRTVGALRDIADYGAQQAPGNVFNQDPQTGPSLVTRIFRIWISTQSDADQQKAQAFAKALISALKGDSGPQDWVGLLKTIPNLAGNPMLEPAREVPKGTTDTDTDKEFYRRLAAFENLHLAFTQNEVLSDVVTVQWDDFYKRTKAGPAAKDPLAATDPDGHLWQSFRQTAEDQLAKIDLRQQLAAGNLGAHWKLVLSEMAKALPTTVQASTPAASRAALRTGLSNALCSVLTDTLTSPVRTPFDPSPLLTCLFSKSNCGAAVSSRSCWVDLQLKSIIKDAPDPTAADPKQRNLRQRTRTSEGITLTLDSLSSQDADLDDPNDPMRSLAGLCVLARQTDPTNKQWKCLNLAIACLDSDGRQVLTRDGVVVPLPLHNQAGLRSAMITYNNRPLMGLSPDMEFGAPLKSQDANHLTTRLIEYLHPSLVATATADGKIPGLAFGKSYDFLVGIMRNSGALPSLFADTAKPGTLNLNSGSTVHVDELEKVFVNHGLSQVSYLRTVPIGELRFGNDDSGFNQEFGLPVIPPEVQPRALDLQSGVTPANETGARAPAPLILLSDYAPVQSFGTDQFSFKVFKPTVDLRTWDAWVAGKGTNPKQRASIWADYNQKANQQANGGTAADLSIDDPAVSQLQLKVEWLDGGPTGSSLTLRWPNPSASSSEQKTLALMRSGPLTVCIHVSKDAPSLSADGLYGADLSIPPGSLARLTLTPILRNGELFANGILADPSSGAPYSFLVETADTGKVDANGKIIERTLPSDQDLRSMLSVADTDEKLTFKLNISPGNPPNKFRNIRHAKLRLQEWRWDGRPGVPFPFPTSGDPKNIVFTDPLKTWEADAFGLRSVNDSSLRVMCIDQLGNSLSVGEDISKDRGALYLRYGIEVFNRYGPLVPPEQRSVNSLGDISTQPLWMRYLVPLRWQGEIPKPAVKLVLPLTSSLETSSRTASLLVVVQGPWYTIGGLAEQMKAELLYTDSSMRLAEAGPDPIRWKGKPDHLVSTYWFGKDKDSSTSIVPGLKLGDLDGPVGHTFDDTDTNPLWVNTSFVIPPIKSTDKNGTSLDTSWDLAKVRFRRIFDSRAPHSPSATKLSAEDEISSKPTEAYWVQFLPNSSYLNGDNSWPASQAVLYIDQPSGNSPNAVITIKIRDKETGIPNSQPIIFRQLENDSSLQHFLLLTTHVPDALGRTNQERFVDVIQQSADGKSWYIASTKIQSAGQLIGRVVEVQVGRDQQIRIGNGSSTDKNLYPSLWAALFPDDPMKDAAGEIVGLSSPIHQMTHESAPCETGGRE